MVSATVVVRMVALASVAFGCGARAESRDTTGHDPETTDESEPPRATGDLPSGTAATDFAQPRECADGVEYGPRGESVPLPVVVDAGNCSFCLNELFGFRAGAGYGFVWRTVNREESSDPNLYSLLVDENFQGGEPRRVIEEKSHGGLEVIPAWNGYAVVTCLNHNNPGWLLLGEELEPLLGPTDIPAGGDCSPNAPNIIWTGQGYLTTFTDPRGLVIATLNERGMLQADEVLTELGTGVGKGWLSRNADRILLVYPSNGELWSGVLDLEGNLVVEARPLGEDSSVTEVSSTGSPGGEVRIVPNPDGWAVASNSSSYGIDFAKVTLDGSVVPQQRLFPRGYAADLSFAPSAYGGYLLGGTLGESGQFGNTYSMLARIDDTGAELYSRQADLDADPMSPVAVVRDPGRDLVVVRQVNEAGELYVAVQEFGCDGG